MEESAEADNRETAFIRCQRAIPPNRTSRKLDPTFSEKTREEKSDSKWASINLPEIFMSPISPLKDGSKANSAASSRQLLFRSTRN